MDITLIKNLAKQYEDGCRDTESTMAFACLEAYETGFEDGVKEAKEQMAQIDILLRFTAGNA